MQAYVELELVPLLEAAIAAEIEQGTWSQRRDALGIALGLHGLRVSEVCRARREDLFISNGKLHVETLKRGRPRDVPLHHSLVAALLEWRSTARVPHLLFTRTGNRVYPTQLQRAARQLIKRVVSEPMRFHALRHTFATRLYAETPDIMLVAKLLGHRSVRSTEVYVASLATVPDACLVRLRSDARPEAPVRLKLFSPAG